MRYSQTATDHYRRAFRRQQMKQWLLGGVIVGLALFALAGVFFVAPSLLRTDVWNVPVQQAAAKVVQVNARQARFTTFYAKVAWQGKQGQLIATLDASSGSAFFYVGQKLNIRYQQDANGNIRVVSATPAASR